MAPSDAVRPKSEMPERPPLRTTAADAVHDRWMKTLVRAVSSFPVSIPVLAIVTLALQVADLATFLVAVRQHPVLLHFEIGIIRATYLNGGPLAAIAFKLAGIAVVFAALAVYGGRWTRAVLVAMAVMGALGAYANVSSIETTARMLAG